MKHPVLDEHNIYYSYLLLHIKTYVPEFCKICFDGVTLDALLSMVIKMAGKKIRRLCCRKIKWKKLKPSFSIIKDNKAKDRAGMEGQASITKF